MSQARADGPPPGPQPQVGALQSGDTPLSTLDTFQGTVDVMVDVVPHGGAIDPSGTFTIAGIPAGASIVKAWFFVTSFDSSVAPTLSATFAATALGSKPPDVSDPGGGLVNKHWRFDVTSLVTGNGGYTYSTSGGAGNAYGDALVVVFNHSSVPVKRIVINDGGESLASATSSTSFGGFAAGPGRLIVFTQADDTGSGGGESLVLNGSTVLGPGDIYNQNQGSFATLIDIPVSVIAGANTMDVVTAGDWFGLHLGILTGPTPQDPAIGRLEAKLDRLEGKADRLEAKSDGIGGGLVRLEGKADRLEGKADRLEGKIDRLEAKADSAAQALGGLGQAVGRLEGKADRLESKADRLEGKIDRMEAKSDAIGGGVERLEGKADRLEAKADHTNIALERLEGKADKLESKADRLEAKSDALDARITQLENMLREILEMLRSSPVINHPGQGPR